jgi:hypothetical protein
LGRSTNLLLDEGSLVVLFQLASSVVHVINDGLPFLDGRRDATWRNTPQDLTKCSIEMIVIETAVILDDNKAYRY